MAPRSAAPIEGQGSLFTVENRGHDSLHTRLHFEPKDFNVLDTEHQADGPAVNVVEHLEARKSVLDELALISRGEGLIAAYQTPHKGKIDERYSKAAALVVERTEEKNLAREKQARHKFWIAGGYLAMVASGVINVEEAKDVARADFKRFKVIFGGSQNSQARDKERKKLVRARRIIAG